MDGDPVIGEPSESDKNKQDNNAPTTFTEVFMKVFPSYMVMGMTYEQFWYGDPWMVVTFEQAYLLKQRKTNEQMWIMGAYVANAVATALNNGFSKRKIDYLKSPLDIYPKTNAEDQEEIRQERQKLVQSLSMLAVKFKQKQKGTDQNG